MSRKLTTTFSQQCVFFQSPAWFARYRGELWTKTTSQWCSQMVRIWISTEINYWSIQSHIWPQNRHEWMDGSDELCWCLFLKVTCMGSKLWQTKHDKMTARLSARGESRQNLAPMHLSVFGKLFSSQDQGDLQLYGCWESLCHVNKNVKYPLKYIWTM